MFTSENSTGNRSCGSRALIVGQLVADGRADKAAHNHRPQIGLAALGLTIDRHILGPANTLVLGRLAHIAAADRVGFRHCSQNRLDARLGGGGAKHGDTHDRR